MTPQLLVALQLLKAKLLGTISYPDDDLSDMTGSAGTELMEEHDPTLATVHKLQRELNIGLSMLPAQDDTTYEPSDIIVVKWSLLGLLSEVERLQTCLLAGKSHPNITRILYLKLTCQLRSGAGSTALLEFVDALVAELKVFLFLSKDVCGVIDLAGLTGWALNTKMTLCRIVSGNVVPG